VNNVSSGLKMPFRLRPELVERVWGSHDLRPWYEVQSEKAIGEAWLTGDACLVETGPLAGETLFAAFGKFPLLVKMLFPQDKLSVQVHPDDADAARLGAVAASASAASISKVEAKTECWYILHAEPGASVALGLRPGVDTAAVRAAIEDGTLEALVEQVPVSAGDMVYVPAGTIHAIGPGVVILEIQQNSDTTYRLYDYGRPRELHLEKGLGVLKLETEAGKVAAKAIEGGVQLSGTELIRVPHFTVERYEVTGAELEFAAAGGAQVVIALEGEGVVRGEGGEVALKAGEAVVVPHGGFAVRGSASVVRCWV
jgi:mannose-6-phosphate isomerase